MVSLGKSFPVVMKMKNRDGEYKKFLGFKDVTNHSPKVEETIQSTHLKKKKKDTFSVHSLNVIASTLG